MSGKVIKYNLHRDKMESPQSYGKATNSMLFPRVWNSQVQTTDNIEDIFTLHPGARAVIAVHAMTTFAPISGTDLSTLPPFIDLTILYLNAEQIRRSSSRCDQVNLEMELSEEIPRRSRAVMSEL